MGALFTPPSAISGGAGSSGARPSPEELNLGRDDCDDDDDGADLIAKFASTPKGAAALSNFADALVDRAHKKMKLVPPQQVCGYICWTKKRVSVVLDGL